MATMSYCAVENTANDLQVVMDCIEEHGDVHDWMDELNNYEVRNLNRLRELAKDFLAATDELQGRLP